MNEEERFLKVQLSRGRAATPGGIRTPVEIENPGIVRIGGRIVYQSGDAWGDVPAGTQYLMRTYRIVDGKPVYSDWEPLPGVSHLTEVTGKDGVISYIGIGPDNTIVPYPPGSADDGAEFVNFGKPWTPPAPPATVSARQFSRWLGRRALAHPLTPAPAAGPAPLRRFAVRTVVEAVKGIAWALALAAAANYLRRTQFPYAGRGVVTPEEMAHDLDQVFNALHPWDGMKEEILYDPDRMMEEKDRALAAYNKDRSPENERRLDIARWMLENGKPVGPHTQGKPLPPGAWPAVFDKAQRMNLMARMKDGEEKERLRRAEIRRGRADDLKARVDLRALANDARVGDVKALLRLGALSLQGIWGVPRDPKVAEESLRKAAAAVKKGADKRDDAVAAAEWLALAYATGAYCLPRDLKLAKQYADIAGAVQNRNRYSYALSQMRTATHPAYPPEGFSPIGLSNSIARSSSGGPATFAPGSLPPKARPEQSAKPLSPAARQKSPRRASTSPGALEAWPRL